MYRGREDGVKPRQALYHVSVSWLSLGAQDRAKNRVKFQSWHEADNFVYFRRSFAKRWILVKLSLYTL